MTKNILKVNEDASQQNEKDQLHAELVSQLYTLAPAGTIATLLNSSLLIFVLWNDISRAVLMSWYSSLLLFTLVRYILFFRYKRAFVTPAESYRWGTRFVSGMALVGMLWGSAGVFLFVEDSILLQVLLVFVLGGMVAGAAASFSALIRSFLAFSLPASLPVIFRILVVGDKVHLAMAGMSLLFVVLMYFIAQRMHNVIVSSLKLRIDNQGLVTYLSAANDEAVILNKELKNEIAERKKTEDELKRHRNHLEDIVAVRTSEISDANAKLQWEINERKKAEEALKKSEEYFRMLIENTSDIITILDSNGMIQYESPSISSILGYGDEELIGREVFDLIHSEDHRKARGALHIAVENPGETESSEVRFRHKDGSWRVLAAVGKAVINESVPVFVINSRDITDQKVMEEELISSRKLESLGVLAGGIAHDFNNLLTGVMGNINLSRRYLDPGNKAYAYMDEAEKAVHRASGLTKQLLTFSKGGSPIKKAASVEKIIRDSADFALRGSNVTCHYHMADDLRDVGARRRGRPRP